MQPITLSANKNWKFFRGQPPKGFYDNKENYHNKGLDCFEMAYDVSAWETVQLPHTVRVEKLLRMRAAPRRARDRVLAFQRVDAVGGRFCDAACR